MSNVHALNSFHEKGNVAVESSQQTAKRILVLGSSLSTHQVASFTWDQLPRSLNVADYDVVIFNLVPALNENVRNSIDVDKLPSPQQVTRLLFSKDSEILFIGPPTELGERQISVTSFLPCVPRFSFESGEQIQDVDPEFAYFFQHVRQWFFHIATSDFVGNRSALPYYLEVIGPPANSLYIDSKPIAQTRYQTAIAIELQFQALLTYPHERTSLEAALGHKPTLDHNVVAESGKVIWLPAPTGISVDEGIRLILQERYGIALEQTAPEWTAYYKLPQQLPIETKMTDIRQEIRRLTLDLSDAQQQFKEATRFQKLLYEQGEALELIVRDVLHELGAKIQEPKQPGHEDGRLEDPRGRKGMLEIKGLKKSLELKAVRQLDQWVRDAMAEEEWQGKGILIANTYCGILPGQRDNPFPDNCQRTAVQFGSCLMTTTQLFRALCDQQCGILDVEQFWDTIFSTDGACSLPELEAVENQ